MIAGAMSPEAGLHSRILVVDDMEANRAVLCRRLERFGYVLESVDSGAAALAAIAAAPPDVVLLDYMMPQMSGIEVLHKLRQNPATRELPVIMVTARAESEATVEALGAGADDYVTKPIDFDVLRARIEAHLSKRESAHNLKRANAVLDERVTVRAMALADLETELKAEVDKRRELERKLAELGASGRSGATPPEDAPAAASTAHLHADVTRIADKFEVIFQNATAGRIPNFAHMAELKLLIERLKSGLSGG